MTTQQIIQSADYSSVLGTRFYPPVTAGLLGLFQLGGSAELTVRDLARLGDGDLVGAPTIGADYASFVGSSSYMQLAVAETAALTWAVAARAASGTTFAGADVPVFLSNGVGGSTGGASLYLPHGTNPSATLAMTAAENFSGTTTEVNTTVTDNQSTSWGWYFGKIDVTNPSAPAYSVGNTTRSLLTGPTATTHPRVLAPNLVRIGSNYAGSTGGCDVALAVFFNRVTTAPEDAAIYAMAQLMLAKRGITI